MSLRNKALAILAFSAIGTLVLGSSSSNYSSTRRLSCAGATFPARIYTRWFDYLSREGGPKVNYPAVGSGHGREYFLDQTVDFGATDDPMKLKEFIISKYFKKD